MDDSAYRKRMMMSQLEQMHRAYLERIKTAPPDQQRTLLAQLNFAIYKKKEEIMRMG